MTAAPARLNLAQQAAVEHLRGPCLVLAGAGSGKTRVITQKIARLIETGVSPERIAAITFTNKAAAEMRERTRALVGKAAGAVLISTFHALGVRLLREDGAVLGLKPNFSIMASDDVLQLIKECAATTDAKLARQWQWQISAWKNAGLDADTALAQAANEGERQVALLMARYHERLTAYQAVDFDDLIGLPLKLLQNHVEVADKWQQRLVHVLVDEYQDTNAIQYELMRQLVGERANFTAVGDDDQSIYGWRGATLDNLRRLPEDFPRLEVIKLEQNYRSTGAILEAANHVIAPNPRLFEKRLHSSLGAGEPVRVVDSDHERHEADRIVARIQSLRQTSTKKDWRDFAVLYRANHQARVIEQALRRAQIPYKVSGGTSFFDRAEIRDLCAWLRLVVNENDDPAFLRAITVPKRGVGHQTLGQLGEFAARLRLSLFGTLFAQSLAAAVSARAQTLLHEFGRQVSDLRARARDAVGSTEARAVLDDWLQAMGYEAHLHATSDSTPQAEARWSNVQDFCDWMANRCDADSSAQVSTGGRGEQSLLDVAQTVSLVSTLNEREQDANVVTLSTLHAAKGLEWTHVVLAGVIEDMLPFRVDDELDAERRAERLQEERRLMYVGITRARETLAVSWTRRRKRGRETVVAKPSRFIAEMRLNEATVREDPREKLKALRAEFAKRASDQALG